MSIFILLIFGFYVQANDSKLALIYQGPGSCEEGCSEAAREMATLAGFKTKFIGPGEVSAEVFQGASIWIQPGGKSSLTSKTMAPELKENIRRFVSTGGGYVGFCAGGFFATEWIADRKVQGLGILPGTNALYQEKAEAVIFPIQWHGARQVYWEGGPYFLPPQEKQNAPYEVMATYPNSSIASVRSQFGGGRVYVTGLHPEAPQSWRNFYKISDVDGLDYDLAVQMIQWAAK